MAYCSRYDFVYFGIKSDHMRNFLVFLIIINSFSCSGSPPSGAETKGPEKIITKDIPKFFGRIVYSAAANGSDQSGVDLFKAGAASKVELWNSKSNFRMIETGGFFKANVTALLDSNQAWWIYPEKKEYEKSGFMDMDEMDADVKAFMPKFFTPPQLDATGEKDTILGKECRKFKISNSSIMKPGASGFAWLWEERDYPQSRFEFETEWKKTNTPLPLNLFQPHGVVMKIEITEGGVIAVYKAVELEEKEIATTEFDVPAGYKLKKTEK